MKNLFQIFLLLFSFACISQKTAKPTDVVKLISSADTVTFVVKTSGCFDAGTTVYKIAKQKKDRIVIYTTRNNVKEIKKLSAKNYEAFLNNYKISEKRFRGLDQGACTLTTDFELSGKKQSSQFTNRSCEAEYNPEEVLKQLMK